MHTAGIGWSGTVEQLLDADLESLVGHLASASARSWGGAVEHAQILVWRESLTWLTEALSDLIQHDHARAEWGVVLEYEIPRRGYRIDALLLADGLIIPIEFKSRSADLSSIRQAEDYGLELSDFHRGSRDVPITPVLCSRGAEQKISSLSTLTQSMVTDVSLTPPDKLADTVTILVARYASLVTNISDIKSWISSAYEPTPTIIEAATALYAGHRVEEITRSEARTDQLAATESAVNTQLEFARQTDQKVICFITGIPGAGKTLAGLNIVNSIPGANATFLSGNGPLVKILREALAQDNRSRSGAKISEARRQSSTFVTNVHRWLDDYIGRFPDRIPLERMVVFDEAQRAWSREHSNRKFSRDASEPEMMLAAMDRHPDWAVIVALVGGGQEINTGEAGLAEWGRALHSKFRHWRVAVSPQLLTGGMTANGSALFETVPEYLGSKLTSEPDLHLAVSQRSFRTNQLNEWVEAVLDSRPDDAARITQRLTNYPLAITRNIDAARHWLRSHARGLRKA